MDAQGRPSFSRSNSADACRRRSTIKRASVEMAATFFAFDFLAFDGLDLRPLPLSVAQASVGRIPQARCHPRLDHIEREGNAFWAR
jgi:ATP-dependent DNA ligase